MMTMTPGKYWGLRRIADDAGRFKMLAVDQRPPIKDLVKTGRNITEAPEKDVAAIKRLLVEELGEFASGVLLDPHHAYPAAIEHVPHGCGLLLTLEDSVFEQRTRGRLSSEIDDWSVGKIRRIGADAVKLLAWYRPDADPRVNEHQQQFVERVGTACARFDIPVLCELLVYSFPDDENHDAGYVEQSSKHAEHVIESVETFSDPRYGVDVFKLESPLNARDVPDPLDEEQRAIDEAQRWFNDLDAAAKVPWVMLSAGATKQAFTRILTYAYRAGASGFLAGRAIWWDEMQAFPDIERARTSLRSTSAAYMVDINRMTDREATPFVSHRSVAPLTLDSSFRTTYGDVT